MANVRTKLDNRSSRGTARASRAQGCSPSIQRPMAIASQSPRARTCRGAGRPLVQVVGVASQRKARSGSAGCTSRRDDRFPPQLLGRLGHRSRRRGRHVEKRRLARRQAEAGLAEVGGWGRTLRARGRGWRPRSASARRTLPRAEADSGRRTLPLPNSEKKRVDSPQSSRRPRGRRALKIGMRAGVCIR